MYVLIFAMLKPGKGRHSTKLLASPSAENLYNYNRRSKGGTMQSCYTGLAVLVTIACDTTTMARDATPQTLARPTSLGLI